MPLAFANIGGLFVGQVSLVFQRVKTRCYVRVVPLELFIYLKIKLKYLMKAPTMDKENNIK
jgi:hypothetical protein